MRGTVLWYYPSGVEDEDDEDDDDDDEKLDDMKVLGVPVNRPRGFLDLSQDKTMVHASRGHLSGAPSPFCLSIQVNEQTRCCLLYTSPSPRD